jgi:hypothetical protein
MVNIVVPINPKNIPDSYPIICNIPITIASYIGKVNSPAKEQLTGKCGTSVKPRNVVVAPTKYMFFV